MTISALARQEIRNLSPYQPESVREDSIRLHANEAPDLTDNGSISQLNRYPHHRPISVTRKLAAYYGVPPENVLTTRGSSEGIDLLIRAFCRPGHDQVLQTPPVFDMYRIYASIQGVATISVPLDGDSFCLNVDSLLRACSRNTKLIFLCTPNNPIGSSIPKNQILDVVRARADQSLVVVDEAYVEFCSANSLVTAVSEHDNLVVLRTLSKAFALAGARIGAVIASERSIRLLDRILAPYALSTPVIEAAEFALQESQVASMQKSITRTIAERERVSAELNSCPAVEFVYPSHANFVLVRFRSWVRVNRLLHNKNIVVRTFPNDSNLTQCARITISSEADNTLLMDTIRGIE